MGISQQRKLKVFIALVDYNGRILFFSFSESSNLRWLYYLLPLRDPSSFVSRHRQRWNFWISGRHYIGSPATKPRTKIRSANWHKCISLAPSLGVLFDFSTSCWIYTWCTSQQIQIQKKWCLQFTPFPMHPFLSFTVLMRMMVLNHQDLLKAFMDPLISLKHLEGKSLGKAS